MWANLLGGQREELVIGSGRGGQLGIYAGAAGGALADVYGDGTLDDVRGRAGDSGAIPGGEPIRRLYRNVGGRLGDMDEENRRVLAKVGLVNGAVWSDSGRGRVCPGSDPGVRMGTDPGVYE